MLRSPSAIVLSYRFSRDGVKFGRPESPIPENFDKIVKDWEKGTISTIEVLRLCNMSESTFYRRRREQKLIQN